jgi:hypothetical protein
MPAGTLQGGTSVPPAAWAPPREDEAIFGFLRGNPSLEWQLTPSSPGDAHAAGAEPPRAYH